MLKFNNDHIITGHIKELLSSFNLPKYRVYTKEYQDYFDKNGTESPEIIPTICIEYNEVSKQYTQDSCYAPYIKDNIIQYYVRSGESPNYTYSWKTYLDPKNSKTTNFNYNLKCLNWTKNLKITNNIYDSYTHEYLGEYLRFKRDYLGIDLMPLYNCFSNTLCPNLRLTKTDTTSSSQITYSFDTSNTNFKIYMVPVKLFKQYTIAIDCDATVELCCGIYDKYYTKNENLKELLPLWTYTKVNKTIFCQPIVFDGLTYDYLVTNCTSAADKATGKGIIKNVAKVEDDLKLFIKLPANNTSAIVILEGDYRRFNDSKLVYTPTKWVNTGYSTKDGFYWGDAAPVGTIGEENSLYLNRTDKKLFKKNSTDWVPIKDYSDKSHNTIDPGNTLPRINSAIHGHDLFILTAGTTAQGSATEGTLYEANNPFIRQQNYAVTNFDTTVNDFSNFKPITALQLCRMNTKESYPFADRLIEYLFDNVVSPEDQIRDNVRRTQTVISLNADYADPECAIWDAQKQKFVKGSGKLITGIKPTVDGVWTDSIRAIVYDKFNMNVAANINDTNHDILGYIDKDIEKHYRANSGEYLDKEKTKPIFTTISSIDLYTGKNGLYSEDED